MNNHPMTLDGTCNPRFDPLRELFAARLESGDGLAIKPPFFYCSGGLASQAGGGDGAGNATGA
jgi:hypothetical protein